MKKGNLKIDLISLFSGTVIAQSISIVASFLIAKLFSSESFGEYAFFYSFSSFVSIILTLRTEYLVVLSSQDSKLSVLYTFFVIIFNTILLSLFLFFLDFNLFPFPSIKWFHIVIACLLQGGIKTMFNYLIAEGKFVRISLLRVFQAASIIMMQLVLFYLKIENPLILGFILGLCLTIIMFPWREFRSISRFVSFVRFREHISQNKRLLLFGGSADALNSLSSNFIPIALGYLISEHILGLYFFAVRVVLLPISLISSSTSGLFFQKASQYKKKNNYAKIASITLRFQGVNFILMIFYSLFIFYCMATVLNFFFEDKWNDSLRYMYYLIPLILFRGTFSPTSNLFEVMDLNGANLILNSCLVLGNIVFMTLLYTSLISVDTSLFLVSCVSGTLYLFVIIYVYIILGNKREENSL